MTEADRFWAKITKSDGCWTWTGATQLGGYGNFRRQGHGRMQGAHRFSWELSHGPVPIGLCVLHRCDNPPCVNPAHLFLGTHADNVADKQRKGRCSRVGPRGSRSHLAKLTESQVESVLASSDSDAALAAAYGVHRMTVSNIRKGHTWKHLRRPR